MKNKLFSGVMPALVTPFDSEGALKEAAAQRLIQWELSHDIQGFYINGATGEGLFLPEETRRQMAEIAVSLCKGRGVVINHVGAVDPAQALRLARHAGQTGCSAISSMAPNYLTTYTDDQVLDYYKRLADAASLPVLVYCTGLLKGDPVRFMEKAMGVEGIVGLKYTLPNYYNLQRITQLNHGDINVINGPDEMLVLGLFMGADGGIGSTYNLMPGWFADLYAAFRRGEIWKAREIQLRINKVIAVLLEYGCIPAIKEGLSLLGFDPGQVAYPGKRFSEAERAAFRREMEQAGYSFERAQA